MSDAQQAPVIQLDIDQALFIDVVRRGDVVEDATVATEVTNLNRADDAYVLQGTIVLSGRLSHRETSDADAISQILLEHRLPFQLRVAAKSQPRGIVNVASRIANCRFDVVDDHWLHMEGDLQVSGLNGRDGFHFQCGSQEFGTLYTTIADDARQNDGYQTENPASPTEPTAPQLDVQTADAQGEFAVPFGQDDEPTIEFIPPLLHDVRSASLAGENAPSGKDLADFDRALDGQSAPTRDQIDEGVTVEAQEFRTTNTTEFDLQSQTRVASEQLLTEGSEVNDTTATANEAQQLESFEFEHQVSLDETLNEMHVKPSGVAPDAPFSAARSFSEDRFVPHVGFTGVPDEAFRGEVTVLPGTLPETGEVVEATVQNQVQTATNLWSFVDFNQPEQRYTLRYVVVMDDETLQAVADRLGCKVSELMAVNHLKSEEVFVGQTLRVPSTVVHFAMLT